MDLPLYNEYEGTFENKTTSLSAAQALGTAKWALLANHGALVVGKDLRQAHLRVVTLEWRCKRAYEVELLGGGVPLPDEEVEKSVSPMPTASHSAGGYGPARITSRPTIVD